MTTGGGRSARDAFEGALDLPPSRRLAFLRTTLENDAEAREEAESLLEHHARASGFLDPPTDGLHAHLAAAAAQGVEAGLEAGRLILDRFRLEEPIGGGGAGAVWRATDIVTQDDVAVKVEHGPARRPADAMRREAGLLRLLHIPGVVRMRDEGLHEGRAVLVTDHVDGAPFPGADTGDRTESVVRRAIALLETLARMHAVGVVHGDLKPANVLVDRTGRVTVLDLGESRDGRGRTGDGAPVWGTPPYVAPELYDGARPGAGTDLYAVGVLLDESIAAGPSVVRARIAELMHPSPDARPASAADAARRLRGCLGDGAEAAGITLPQATSESGALTQTDLVRLFHGPERLLHVPSDAAALLHRRTDGDPERVAETVGQWLRTGLVRLDGDRLRTDRRALIRLASSAPVAEKADPGPTGLAAASRRIRRALTRDDPRPALLTEVRGMRRAGDLESAVEVVRAALRMAGSDGDTARALVEELVATALQDGRGSVLDEALYEIDRADHARDLGDLRALLQCALLAENGARERAAERLSVSPLLQSPAMGRWVWAVLMRSAWTCDPAVRRETVEAATDWADRFGDGEARAAAQGWLGWLAYREGRYTDAAGHHARHAEQTEFASARISAILNAGSASMEAFDLEGGRTAGQAALGELAGRRLPMLEARAWHLVRSCTYRMELPMTPDEELCQAARAIAFPSISSLTHLTEAAVAWRRGQMAVAARLAGRAAELCRAHDSEPGATLAESLRVATGRGAETAAAVADAARQLDMNDIAMQSLALVLLGAPQLRSDHADHLKKLADRSPRLRSDTRLEVLSVEEAAAAARGSAPSPMEERSAHESEATERGRL